MVRSRSKDGTLLEKKQKGFFIPASWVFEM
jgi:hypothetical protein